jgi:hypothetical protein
MKRLKEYPGFIGFVFALGIACLVSLVVTVAAQAQGATRVLPAGATGYTEIIEVLASESYVIPAIWNNSTISIKQAEGTTEKFRVAIGTSTVDPLLPLVDSVSISFRSGGFVALKAETASSVVAVYHVKE